MPRIDPSSRVADGARLADDVEIGPFCIVGPRVELPPRDTRSPWIWHGRSGTAAAIASKALAKFQSVVIAGDRTNAASRDSPRSPLPPWKDPEA